MVAQPRHQPEQRALASELHQLRGGGGIKLGVHTVVDHAYALRRSQAIGQGGLALVLGHGHQRRRTPAQSALDLSPEEEARTSAAAGAYELSGVDERVRRVDGGAARVQGGEPSEHAGLLRMGVDERHLRLARETCEAPQRAAIVARGRQVAHEVHRFIADAGPFHPPPDRAVRAARDHRPETVGPQPLHDLSDMLGHASVTWLQGVEDHWLLLGHGKGA